MPKPFLKREALEKLASPEQLDKLLVIIKLPGWIALFSLLLLFLGFMGWAIFGKLPITSEGFGIFLNPQAIQVIQSESPGLIESIQVQIGDVVKKGDPLLSILPSTTQKSLLVVAPEDGLILTVEVLQGEEVEPSKTLFWLEKKRTLGDQDLIYSFFPVGTGSQIKPGMRALIQFDSIQSEIYGKMEGVVQKILPFAVNTQGEALQSLPSVILHDYLSRDQARLLVLIKPVESSTPSGFKWTTQEGPPHLLTRGAVAQVEILLDEKRPITYLIPLQR